MDDNNRFLNSYKKKMAERADDPEGAPEPETPRAMRYEERSGFAAPRQNGRARVPHGGARPNYLIPSIIGALVVVGIVALLLVLLNRGVQVIDLTGMSIGDAQLWANTNGLKLQEQDQYNDQVDAGKVISQDPQKGAAVKKGTFVKAVVSNGHDLTVTLKLPDLMSMTKDDVDKWTADNYMAKVRVTSEFSDTVAEGKVISYQINDNTVVGDVVSRNTPIYIVVSNGPEDQAAALITVPDFKQKTVSESYDFANDNGLVLEVTEQYDDYAPKGTILSQSVKADSQASKGETITLTVSKGKKITVPDFSADSKETAQAVAGELGITSTIVEKYSGEPAGAFISQSIPADAVYDGEDVLELDYSLGNEIVVASFVGQTLDAIQAWAQGLNAQGASISVSVTYTNNDAPSGTIIHQDKANRTIGVKTTIYVDVSKGKIVFMPDFVAPAGSPYGVAVTREDAMAQCQDLGIVPVFRAVSNSGRLPGEIWDQSIPAGTEVSEGTTVTLKYVPANVQVTVPDFTGMSQADIEAGGYDMQLDIKYEPYASYVSGYEGKVCDQSLRAQSKAAAGSEITLYIGPSH